jgi:hypothetical protein
MAVTPSISPAIFGEKTFSIFSTSISPANQKMVLGDLAKNTVSIFSTSISPAYKKMVLGDLAAKERKDSNHARQQCMGRLGSCSVVLKIFFC